MNCTKKGMAPFYRGIPPKKNKNAHLNKTSPNLYKIFTLILLKTEFLLINLLEEYFTFSLEK